MTTKLPSLLAAIVAHDGAARRSDPETSKAAARQTNATHLSALVLTVLQLSIAPMTAAEVADALDLDLQSVTPRFKPLARAGLIEVAGTKLNSNKRSVQTWRIKEVTNAVL